MNSILENEKNPPVRLEERLKDYSASDAYAFHMPGHKRILDPLFGGSGLSPYQIDITEIDGFDNLHFPEGLLLEEMKAAASFYGTKDTFFSVNGSTCALLAAVSAAVPSGGTLLMERGCHISVYHAAYLRRLHTVFIGEDLSSAAPDAVILTSPSYGGCLKDIAKWAAYAHERKIPLIVDEAHGAHFGMHPFFPESAITMGADLVIQSVHKTLPAMTQTALLHRVTERVSRARLQYFLDIYETSSPSYVLLASITSAVHLCMDHGGELFGAYAGRLEKLRLRLAGLRFLRLAGGEAAMLETEDEFPPYPAGTCLDPGKILILTGGSKFDGPEVYDLLRDRYHLQMEMKGPDYVLAMTSPADTEEGCQRLAEALFELDSCGAAGEKAGRKPCFLPELHFPGAMKISDAADAESEMLPLSAVSGRISAGFILQYPPDIPILIPGEIFTDEAVERIKKLREMGFELPGICDGQAAVVQKS